MTELEQRLTTEFGKLAEQYEQEQKRLAGQVERLEEQVRPRILFLADRNILADQAYNAFSAFPEDAMARILPGEIRKKGKVPKNASLFFTIFQTFMSGPPKDGQPSPYFGDYPPDFFDFIVIDECHRGGTRPRCCFPASWELKRSARWSRRPAGNSPKARPWRPRWAGWVDSLTAPMRNTRVSPLPRSKLSTRK